MCVSLWSEWLSGLSVFLLSCLSVSSVWSTSSVRLVCLSINLVSMFLLSICFSGLSSLSVPLVCLLCVSVFLTGLSVESLCIFGLYVCLSVFLVCISVLYVRLSSLSVWSVCLVSLCDWSFFLSGLFGLSGMSCLSICWSFCLSVLSVSLSGLSVFLSVSLSCLSVCLFCLSVCLRSLSVSMSVSLSICVVCLVCLSGISSLFCQFSLSGPSIVLLFLSVWSVCQSSPSFCLISLSA